MLPDIEITAHARIRERVAAGERVLVTTLTKRMAEDLTQYFAELGVRVRYLHSATSLIETIGRAARNVNGTVTLYADHMTDSLTKAIAELEKQMKSSARHLEFEEAATIRDRIKELRTQQIYKT